MTQPIYNYRVTCADKAGGGIVKHVEAQSEQAVKRIIRNDLAWTGLKPVINKMERVK